MSDILMGIIGLFFANAGLILWMRSESRSDWRHMDASIQSMKQDTDAKLDAMKRDTDVKLDAIHEEMKDFHGRLCAIEEKRRRE